MDNKDAIYFVSRTENNNGVSAIVRRLPDVEPNPGHTLSVAGGGSVLSTFYQPLPYYNGRDLYVLIPNEEMSITRMQFHAYCIRLNKYKYNYGRQANRTLKDILIPEKMPIDFWEAEKNIVNSLQSISASAFAGNQISAEHGHHSKPSAYKAELTDKELVEKYGNGKKADFADAIGKMTKAPSLTAKNKTR